MILSTSSFEQIIMWNCRWIYGWTPDLFASSSKNLQRKRTPQLRSCNWNPCLGSRACELWHHLEDTRRDGRIWGEWWFVSPKTKLRDLFWGRVCTKIDGNWAQMEEISPLNKARLARWEQFNLFRPSDQQSVFHCPALNSIHPNPSPKRQAHRFIASRARSVG